LSLTQNQKFTIILEKKKIKIQAHFQTCSRYFQKVSRYKYFFEKYLDIDTFRKKVSRYRYLIEKYLDIDTLSKKYLDKDIFRMLLEKYLDTFKILSEKKYLDTDTFSKKYLDIDTFQILS